jgi:hypothetical protein
MKILELIYLTPDFGTNNIKRITVFITIFSPSLRPTLRKSSITSI